jgi:hypothetical protein
LLRQYARQSGLCYEEQRTALRVPAEMSDAPSVIVVDGKICCFIQQTLGILVE